MPYNMTMLNSFCPMHLGRVGSHQKLLLRTIWTRGSSCSYPEFAVLYILVYVDTSRPCAKTGLSQSVSQYRHTTNKVGEETRQQKLLYHDRHNTVT